jgi:hypothetical protein
MSDIYRQHEAAFSNVSAYVIMAKGERVATIAFKYPRDGAGRLYAYVHWFGVEMVRGWAAGDGYDKHSAACADAARKITLGKGDAPDSEGRTLALAFIKALGYDGAYNWERSLRDAGFEVLRAV